MSLVCLRRLRCLVPRPRTWGWRRWLLVGTTTALLSPLALAIWYTTLGGNFHTVIPGKAYRAAQPSAATIEHLVASYQIRTIVNLRGDNDGDWYYAEHETAKRLDVKVVDVGLWAKHPPLADQFCLLVDTLAEAAEPILLHCNNGTDRSGLAAALVLLLRTETGLHDARRQLTLWYGHNPFGMAVCLDRVLHRYEEWLAAHDWEHSPARLRTWAHTRYCARDCER
jgi:hypothetical protein